MGLLRILWEELGITDGINCVTKGDTGACVQTAITVLGSAVGGLIGKVLAKYGGPWKWAKAARLGKRLWGLANKLFSSIKDFFKARRALKVAKSATTAYDEALAGGKHAGFLGNYVDKPTSQIERGISSIEKQIAEHEAKIRNPAAYIDDWASLDPRQQQALLTKKWPGDIARQQEQLAILRGILRNR